MSLFDKLNQGAITVTTTTTSTSSTGSTNNGSNNGGGFSATTGKLGAGMSQSSGNYSLPPIPMGAEWSFNFWINPQSASGNDYILHHRAGGNINSSFYMYNSDDDPLGSGGCMVNARDSSGERLTLDASNNHIFFDLNSNAGSWVMCTITWNNSDKKLRLYQDGSLHATSKAWTHSNAGYMGTSSANWTLGNYQTRTDSTYASRANNLDEWSFWKGTLSQADITELYTGIKASALSSANKFKLMVYYDFEDSPNGTLTNQAPASISTTSYTNFPEQRVVDNFSGSVLDTDRWNSTFTGNGTATMADEFDGGLKVTCASDVSASYMINFNNTRTFSPTGSACIFVGKRVSTTNTQMLGGLSSNTAFNADVAGVKDWTGNTYKQFSTAKNGYWVNANTTVAIDTNWHVHKIELLSASAILSMDGIIEVTNTGNIPDSPLQPVFSSGETSGVASAKTCQIRYMEAYNT